MAVAPEYYRAARHALPRLPLPVICGFALAAIGGSIFLAYTGFRHAEAKSSAAATSDVPVYAARAVPFDPRLEDPAHRAASIAQALRAAQAQVQRAETQDNVPGTASASAPALLAEANRELRGFSGFSNFGGGNNFLALTGTSFGMSAQSLPAYTAPDAETMTAAPVPEASTWMCGGALLILVAVRGAHASWHRKRHRNR